MKRMISQVGFTVLGGLGKGIAVWTAVLIGTSASTADPAKPWPDQLHAFDNGLTRTEPIVAKVRVLKELGYAGVGGRPGQVGEWLAALDQEGLEMVSLYVTVNAEAGSLPLDAQLVREIARLKGRNTIIWLNLNQGESANDEVAVRIIGAVADEARKAGLRVALYPHVNCYTETVEDVARLADQVNRPDVGTSFNLCHFLKTDDEANLEAALRKVAPRLILITLNGADTGATREMNWDRLIQPLGRGTFDNARLLRLLAGAGYRGPVVLQSYGIPGEDRENLGVSMTAWRALTGVAP